MDGRSAIYNVPSTRPNYSVLMVGSCAPDRVSCGTIIGVAVGYPDPPRRSGRGQGRRRFSLRVRDPSSSAPYATVRELHVRVWGPDDAFPRQGYSGCVVRLAGARVSSQNGRLEGVVHCAKFSVFSWSELRERVVNVESGGECGPHWNVITRGRDPDREMEWLCWVRDWWLNQQSGVVMHSSEQLGRFRYRGPCEHDDQALSLRDLARPKLDSIVTADFPRLFKSFLYKLSVISGLEDRGVFVLECMITHIDVEGDGDSRRVSKFSVVDGCPNPNFFVGRSETVLVSRGQTQVEVEVFDDHCSQVLLSYCHLMESLRGSSSLPCSDLCPVRREAAALFCVRVVGLSVNRAGRGTQLRASLESMFRPRVEKLWEGAANRLLQQISNGPQTVLVFADADTVRCVCGPILSPEFSPAWDDSPQHDPQCSYSEQITPPEEVVDVEQIDPAECIEEVEQIDPADDVVEVEQIDPAKGVVEVEQIGPAEDFVEMERINPAEGVVEMGRIDPADGVVEVEQIDPADGVVEVEQIDPAEGVVEVEQIDPAKGVVEVEQIDSAEGVVEMERINPAEGVVEMGRIDPAEGVVEVEQIDPAGSVAVEMEQIDPAEGIVEMEQIDPADGVVEVEQPSWPDSDLSSLSPSFFVDDHHSPETSSVLNTSPDLFPSPSPVSVDSSSILSVSSSGMEWTADLQLREVSSPHEEEHTAEIRVPYVRLQRSALMTRVSPRAPLLSLSAALRPPAGSFRVRCRVQCGWLSRLFHVQVRALCYHCRSVSVLCRFSGGQVHCPDCRRRLVLSIRLRLRLVSAGEEVSVPAILSGTSLERLVGVRLVSSRLHQFVYRLVDVLQQLVAASCVEVLLVSSNRNLLIHDTSTLELHS